MSLSKQSVLAAMLTALLVPASSSNAVELALNGDFETGFFSDWALFPTPSSMFGVVDQDSQGMPAPQGTWFAEFENTQLASALVIKQANRGVGVVAPGDNIRVSFLARGAGEVGGVQFAEFFSELAGGGTSSSEIFGGGPLDVSADTWKEFEFNTVAGSDVSGGVTLQFAITTGAASGSTSFFELDDVSIQIVESPDGDYNSDGTVDLADYTLWRNNLGAPDGTLPNDGDLMTSIGEDHYDLWRANVGAGATLTALTGASVSAVPEPSGCLLIVCAVTVLLWKRL